MGFVALTIASGPGLLFSHELRLRYGIPWIVLTCAFNIMLTCLVTGRLIHFRRNVQRHAVHVQYAEVYTSIPVIFIESALPLTILHILQVAAMARRSPARMFLGPIWYACVVSIFQTKPLLGKSCSRVVL